MGQQGDGTSRRRLLQAGALGAGVVIAPGVLSTGSAAASGSDSTAGTASKTAARIDTATSS